MRALSGITIMCLMFLVQACGGSYDFYETSVLSVPQRFAVFGDSISTGILSDSTIGDSMTHSVLGTIHLAMKTRLRGGQIRRVGIPRNSAARTEQEWGIRNRIGAEVGIEAAEVESMFVGFNGAVFGDTESQLRDLNSLYDASVNGDHKAQNILVMLGGNDYCSSISGNDFRGKVNASLLNISKNHPDARIVVSAIPRIPDLRDIDHQYVFVGGVATLSCDNIRKRYCRSLYRDMDNSRYNEFNAIIEEETVRHHNMLFSDASKNIPSSRENVSIDCFHPSRNWQQELADALPF